MNYELGIMNEERAKRKNRRGFSARTSFFRTLHASRFTLSAGFTLIEMIVSIAIFSFVMLATTAVLLSVVDADHKAQGLKTTINNLSLTLESMTRNLRTGTNYALSGQVNNAVCPSPGGTAISFLEQDGTPVTYALGSNAINISTNGNGLAKMTADEITINNLCFYVAGTGVNQQPKIFVVTAGYVTITTTAGAKAKTTSSFSIQTLVSQRSLNVQAP